MKAECVVDARATLGEVPLWSSNDEVLYWIDVRAPALHTYRPSDGFIDVHRLPEVIGSYCLRAGGGMLLALKSGLHVFDLQAKSLTQVLRLEPDLPNNRLNDGKCDRQGRFWVGSMNDGDRLPTGALYCVDRGWRLSSTLSGLTVPNSLAWSPEGRRMYFADTPTQRIMVFDFDPDDGVPFNPRVFVDLSGQPGRPDGSTVDSDGCLWNAEFNGSRVVRYTPEGRVDRILSLPVSSVTSCAFGGPQLDTLYVTTSRHRHDEKQLREQPLAGGLFAAAVGASGLPEARFRG